MIDKKFNTIRTWEECKEQWQSMLQDKIRQCEQSDKPWARSEADIYRMGQVPYSFPPVGLELSIDEYLQFQKEHRRIDEIHGWCRTGKAIHDYYKTKANWEAGKYNPREGFYKIVRAPFSDLWLDDSFKSAIDYEQALKGEEGYINSANSFCDCYYNCMDGEAFLEEPVTIRINPLFNKNSRFNGTMSDLTLTIGQIVHIIKISLVGKHYEVSWEIL